MSNAALAGFMTTAQMCDAIADSFRTIEGLTVYSFGDLPDSINVVPQLQVYWEGFRVSQDSETDRLTAQKGIMHDVDEFILDLYAAQRGPSLASSMKHAMHWFDKIRVVLEENKKVYFGMVNANGSSFVKWARWQGRRGRMVYNNPGEEFAGVRINITTGVF